MVAAWGVSPELEKDREKEGDRFGSSPRVEAGDRQGLEVSAFRRENYLKDAPPRPNVIHPKFGLQGR